jgi:hypothetical protein
LDFVFNPLNSCANHACTYINQPDRPRKHTRKTYHAAM